MIHRLKSLPEFFDAVARGDKTFEVRHDADRGFAVGDTIVLRRWSPHDQGAYLTLDDTRCSDDACAKLTAVVTYKLPGGKFGISQNTCVLGIKLVDPLA